MEYADLDNPSAVGFVQLAMLPIDGLAGTTCILQLANVNGEEIPFTFKNYIALPSGRHNVGAQVYCLGASPGPETRPIVLLREIHAGAVYEWFIARRPDGLYAWLDRLPPARESEETLKVIRTTGTRSERSSELLVESAHVRWSELEALDVELLRTPRRNIPAAVRARIR